MRAFVLVCLCVAWLYTARAEVVNYRHSGDYTTHAIFFSTNVVLSKVLQELPAGPVLTTFRVSKGTLQADVDLASDPGIVVEHTIATTPTRIGISADKCILLVASKEFDEKKGDDISLIHAILLPSGEVFSESDLDALVRKVPKKTKTKLSEIKMQAVELFFDRMLVSYLEKRSK